MHRNPLTSTESTVYVAGGKNKASGIAREKRLFAGAKTCKNTP